MMPSSMTLSAWVAARVYWSTTRSRAPRLTMKSRQRLALWPMWGKERRGMKPKSPWKIKPSNIRSPIPPSSAQSECERPHLTFHTWTDSLHTLIWSSVLEYSPMPLPFFRHLAPDPCGFTLAGLRIISKWRDFWRKYMTWKLLVILTCLLAIIV